MADRKISDLTALTAPASGDYLPIVDISEAAAASKNKRITIEELFRGIPLGTAAAPSIAIEGNENTGIYSPGAYQVAVATNGTGRLFVDANGNVGIGNSVPATAIDAFNASGSCQVRVVRSGQADVRLIADTGYGGVFVSNAHPLIFRTDNTERLRITSDGKVGIGTSSPGARCQISTTTVGDVNLALSGPTGDNNWGGYLTLNSNNGTTVTAGIQTSTSGMFFSYGGTERLRIDSSGRVGIGTTSPSNLLHLALSGVTGPKIRVQNTNATSNNGELVFAGPGGNIGGIYVDSAGSGGVDVNLVSTNASGSIRFGVGASAEERARIDSSGRLLVGTTSARTLFTGYTPTLQVEASTAGAACASIVNTQSAVGGPVLFLAHSRGANGLLNDGDDLGAISFHGGDGTNLQSVGASITAKVDGAPGAADMPGRLVFSTTADGASSPTERMRISNDGAVKVAGDNFQIATSKTPASATAAGTVGQIAWDANYIYVCTATNTWKRSAIATW